MSDPKGAGVVARSREGSKALFDLLRTEKRAPLTEADVAAVNAIIAGGSRHCSPRGIALIHSFESCRLVAYPDPGSRDGKPWTIGWGSTGSDIVRGTVWTQAQADARFRMDLEKFEAGVERALAGAAATQDQFDALVSFAYNVGLDEDADTIAEGLGDSTLLKKHKAGDFEGAAAQFALWNKNDGRVMAGLTRRRAAEARLYRGLAS